MSNFILPSTLSREQLCEDALVKLDITFYNITLIFSKLSAVLSIQSEYIPHPTDPSIMMRNPFFLATSAQISGDMNTSQAQQYATFRVRTIRTVLDEEVKMDYESYCDSMNSLRNILSELTALSSTDNARGENEIVSSQIEISSITIDTIDEIKQDVIEKLLTSSKALSLKSELEFNDEEAYIEYLREVRKDLYHRLEKQHQVITNLSQQAASLHQSLALYRAK